MRLANPFGTSVNISTPRENVIVENKVESKVEPRIVSRGTITDRRPVDRQGICDTSRVTIDRKEYILKAGVANDAMMGEYLSSVLCSALGFSFVPRTFICRDENYEMFTLQEFRDNCKAWAVAPRLWTSRANSDMLSNVALFDYLVMNADRHAGNFLIRENGEFFAIDHHLTLGNTYEQNWPSVLCYEHEMNESRLVSEFAYRLNRAELEPLRLNLSGRDWDSFMQRAGNVIRYSHLTLREFRDKMKGW